MRKSALILLGLAGCTASPTPPPVYSVPPSLGPRYETEWVEEAVNPALRSARGLTKNQATTFLHEEDRVYEIRACSAGRFTNIRLPAGEELTGEKAAALGDDDPMKWGVYAKKGGKSWVVSIGGKVPGLETSGTLTTTGGIYTFDFTSTRKGCHRIVAFVHPRKIAVKRAVPADYDAAAVNANYGVSLKKGKTPPWMPIRAFDIGTQKIWVEFPGAPGTIGAPAVIAGNGFPVTPRIDGNFYQVDTTASSIELRMNGSVVSIEKGKS